MKEFNLGNGRKITVQKVGNDDYIVKYWESYNGNWHLISDDGHYSADALYDVYGVTV